MNSTIGAVPNRIVYNYEPTSQGNIQPEPLQSENESARVRAEKVLALRKRLQESWEKTQLSVTKYYNARHTEMVFREGEKVMLSSKNLKLKRVSAKLGDKFVGPFEVEKKVGPNAYRLKLPQKYGRLHATFHVSLLQRFKVRAGCEPPDAVDIEGDQEWLVERILKTRVRNRIREWLVQWEGWSKDYSS